MSWFLLEAASLTAVEWIYNVPRHQSEIPVVCSGLNAHRFLQLLLHSQAARCNLITDTYPQNQKMKDAVFFQGQTMFKINISFDTISQPVALVSQK